MNINEERLVNGITDYEANIAKILEYVRDNYNIDGIYDAGSCVIKLVSGGIDNALMLAAAKEYIESVLGDDLVRVVF